MKRIITICTFLFCVVGSCQSALADDTTATGLQSSVQAAPDGLNKPNEVSAPITSTISPPEAAVTVAPAPVQQPNVVVSPAPTPSSQVTSNVVVSPTPAPAPNAAVSSVQERRRGINRYIHKHHPTTTGTIVSSQTPGSPTFSSSLQSQQTTTSVVSERRDVSEEQRFRDRELRERSPRVRDYDDGGVITSEQHCVGRDIAFQQHDRYNRQLRTRVWENINDRDQELRYLQWRERQLSSCTWRENNRICRYVTTYQTGVRIDKNATVCQWRHGKLSCFHPKRYFIYPVTRVVCYRANDQRLMGSVVREYPY